MDRIFTHLELYPGAISMNFMLGKQPLSVTVPLASASKLTRDLNSVLSDAGQPPLLSVEPGETSPIRTPPVLRVEDVTMPGIEGPARIRLMLDNGVRLEIPVKQDAIAALVGHLEKLL